MERLIRRYGASGPSEIVRLGFQTLERTRASEAHDKWRGVVPDSFARYIERACILQATSLMELAKVQSHTPDGQARALAYRQEAGGYYDAAAFASNIVRHYDQLVDAQAQQGENPPSHATTRQMPSRTAPRPSPEEESS